MTVNGEHLAGDVIGVREARHALRAQRDSRVCR